MVVMTLLGSSTLTTLAFALGLYATAVSTLVALVTLYGELFVRVDVIPREAYLVPVRGGSPIIVVGDDALEAIGAAGAPHSEIATVAIRNRGRRAVQIRVVSKANPGGGFYTLDELLPALPLIIEPGHSRELTIGSPGAHPYHHGDLGAMKRFFVVDGAGRIYPVRERWRQLPGRFRRRLVRWWTGRRAAEE